MKTNYIEQAIRKAINDGKYAPFGIGYYVLNMITKGGARFRGDDTDFEFISNEKMFLDPLFWQSLFPKRNIGDKYWLYQWHDFIDHLAAGNDTESYFKELLSQ